MKEQGIINDVNEGSGLGLALVEMLVKEHEGTIEVKSEEGKGSTFTTHALQPLLF